VHGLVAVDEIRVAQCCMMRHVVRDETQQPNSVLFFSKKKVKRNRNNLKQFSLAVHLHVA
jgi:hypothetical protein